MLTRFDFPSEGPVLNSRFANVLSDACPRPLYDTVLRDTGAMVVTPTLGSIIPNWVLAIPKRHAANAARWAQNERNAPLSAIKDAARSFGRDPRDIIWFEHGATEPRSIVGCGVDHAHIHILLTPPFSFRRLCEEAQVKAGLGWSLGSGDGYAAIDSSESYFVAGHGDQFLLAQSVAAAGSQFFRKAIARIVHRDAAWDYRSHPHMENVAETIANASLAA
jgi:ATP adenylyltransferase